MKHNFLTSAILLMFFFLQSNAQTIVKGRAVRILDGDTFELLVNEKFLYKIRMADIDAPEKGQDFGQVAKQTLAALLMKKPLTVKYDALDRNQRLIGHVFVQNEHINLKMVEKGMAWHFKKYSKDETFARAENIARRQRSGLWSQPNAIPPWDYRKMRRK